MSEYRFIESFQLVWFGFFVYWYIKLHGLLNAKATLREEQEWYYLIHNWEDKGASYLSLQGYMFESKRDIATGVQTRLLWFRSPVL